MSLLVQKWYRVVWGGLLLLLCLITLFIVSQVLENSEEKDNLQEIRIGLPLQPSSGLLIVALEKGFFISNGLKPIISEYPSGKRALKEGLFTDSVDLVSTADIPVTIGGFEKTDFRCLTSIFLTDNMNSIVARKDAGIESADGLLGKRIATQKGSAVHYFLYLFLLEHGLSEENVEIVFMKAEELPDAIIKGEIDAFSMRAPFTNQAAERLGDNGITLTAPGLYAQQDVIAVRQKIIETSPQCCKQILQALSEAEEFIRDHPQEAMALIGRRLNIAPQSLVDRWDMFLFRLSLDQSLLVRLEDEARWAIKSQLVQSKEVPNYLTLINTEILRELRPETVTIH